MKLTEKLHFVLGMEFSLRLVSFFIFYYVLLDDCLYETHKLFNLYGYKYKMNFNLKILGIQYSKCQNNNCSWHQLLKGLCSNDNRRLANKASRVKTKPCH